MCFLGGITGFSTCILYGIMFCIKAIFLLVYRSVLFYLLLNFIYITKQMITSFYDYMVSEIDKIHLS